MKQIRLALLSALVVAAIAGVLAWQQPAPHPRILVFSKTAGFRHASIAAGLTAIRQLGTQNGFRVDATEDASFFHEDSLKHYGAVIFLNATGDVLNASQQADFERYIQAGGGFIGIHAAADCEYDWPWYGKLVGAYFKSHPKIQPARLQVVDRSHASTRHLPTVWERSDEWYNFRKVPNAKDVTVLITIDEKSYQGGENGDDHPMAWYHPYDGGRAFYTEFGHTDASFSDPLFLQHVLGGIQYAIGDNRPLDYRKTRSKRVPDEDRFTKNMLVSGILDEPTEMAILPNLDILVVQRKGGLLRYDTKTRQIAEAGNLMVYHKASVKGVNAEEGLMGIAADPDFAHNHWVYLFYAAPDTPMNRLSRFVFRDGQLDMSSEKKILELYSQREICCHTGGSLAFGGDGLLYLSTGDNSTPFNQPVGLKNNGFSPIDHRTGLHQYDASRSSGNTNDLRGKILRIRVRPDGSYDIPDGNLFQPGTQGTRPEIYVMGNRNPYRISVDRKTGFLYWGEVGPDANADSMASRGPRGYDELNQARKAGFFGWPFFVGNNYAYHAYNYSTGESGPSFDPMKPLNNSPNNTGLQELPSVSPAFIWYPYASSPEFPEVGTGGRNAMAGPVYYSEFYPAATRLPDYFNGKLFFYDWIRGWIKIVTMDSEGNYLQMEPFMAGMKFNSVIDMEMGPDGRLYLLEYGSGWFSKNKDAGLARVDYNGGNRAPRAAVQVSRTSGTLPLTIKASAAGSKDADKDALTYVWHFGNTMLPASGKSDAGFTFTKAGAYPVFVEVKDGKGGVTRSEALTVYAGNEEPTVRIRMSPAASFYFAGKPLAYEVQVADKEDGSSEKGGIDPANLHVKLDYLSSSDKAQILGHQAFSSLAEGRNLVATLDCKTCHKEQEKSIGPSYQMVADKYAKDAQAKAYLNNKILKGGSGVWGEVAMAAHPDIKPSDAALIVDWILSLAGGGRLAPSLPGEGSIVPTAKDVSDSKLLLLTASYTDKGASKARPLTGYISLQLRQPLLSVSDQAQIDHIQWIDQGRAKAAVVQGDAGWLMFDGIGLGHVSAIELGYTLREPLVSGYVIEWVADAPDGRKMGEVVVGAGGTAGAGKAKAMLTASADRPVKLYLKVRKVDARETKPLVMQQIRFISD